MNFIWFHLMPYDDLPPGFPQKYRSVWVDPPSAELAKPERVHRLYNEYLDELEYADKLGFDAVGVNEHHQNAYGMMPSPNLMAAALARRTTNAALCVMGNSIALYHPAIRVAEEFAMLDCLSGGRLIAGFPVGTSMDTVLCYGATPASLRDRYYEAHDLIMKAWQDPEIFTWNGRYNKLRYVNIWPRPIQQPHPPIWIPGGGSIETWEWTARNDYVYAALSFGGYIRGKGTMDGYWEQLEKQGKPYNPYRGGFAQLVAVSETDERAEQEYGPHADYFYNNCLHVYPGFADVPGYRTMDSVRAGLSRQLATMGQGTDQHMSWKDLTEGGNIIAGSPATVRDRLREAIKGLRVGQLLLLLTFGDMPRHLVQKNTELFAREVMPHLRDMWSEYEDHWWPKPLAERSAPESMQALPVGG
ncbi:MAG: LLM class flavin-dependent oxidoreductase [Dehalococcoidia bacterium]